MIRCLIVDDSMSSRMVLREILTRAPDLDVVGEAEGADQALGLALQLKPDVITMDVQMPGKDGFVGIEQVMAQVPTPIVVICSGADDASLGIGFRALQGGAVDVLSKPNAKDPKEYERQCELIRTTIRAMSGIKVIGRRMRRESPKASNGLDVRQVKCIGIASSTGGPNALRALLEPVPERFPYPIVVAQHIAEGFCEGMARWLDDTVALNVCVARHGAPLLPGHVYVAPSYRHLVVSGGLLRLEDGAPVSGAKPSGTILLASLAREYGAGAAGFVLTGMGQDGAAGLKAIRLRGGLTVAQLPASAIAPGMPEAAIGSGAPLAILELSQMSELLCRMVGAPPNIKASGIKKRLLLVDDTETVLALERQVLSSNYDVTFARDGQEALDVATVNAFDGIVMDIRMPRMTGDEALRRLKMSAATRNVPVLMVTSESDGKLLQSCWDSGCQAILKKPIDIEELKATVARLVPP